MAAGHQQAHFEIYFDISLIAKKTFQFENGFILNFKNHYLLKNLNLTQQVKEKCSKHV